MAASKAVKTDVTLADARVYWTAVVRAAEKVELKVE